MDKVVFKRCRYLSLLNHFLAFCKTSAGAEVSAQIHSDNATSKLAGSIHFLDNATPPPFSAHHLNSVTSVQLHLDHNFNNASTGQSDLFNSLDSAISANRTGSAHESPKQTSPRSWRLSRGPTLSSWPSTRTSWPSTRTSWPSTRTSWPSTRTSWPSTRTSWPSTRTSWPSTRTSWPSTLSSWPSTLSSWPSTRSSYAQPLTSSTPATKSITHCRDMSESFVYKGNRCGAPDPASYRASWTLHYTCTGRCGGVPAYSMDDPACGCDAICVLYGDCCEDMALLCADLYKRALIQFKHAETFKSECSSSFVGMIRECMSKSSPSKKYRRAATIESLSEAFHAQPVRAKQEDRQVLKRYTKPLTSFPVIDMSLETVHKDHATFSACKSPLSWPYFLPARTLFRCPFSSNSSFLSMVPSCTYEFVFDVRAEIDRGCQWRPFVICGCENKSTLSLPLYRVCMGRTAIDDPSQSESATAWHRSFFPNSDYSVDKRGMHNSNTNGQ